MACENVTSDVLANTFKANLGIACLKKNLGKNSSVIMRRELDVEL
jgi:hypothetical protein